MEDELSALIKLALGQDGLFLGLGIGLFAVRTWWNFRTHAKALAEIKETPMTDISDLPALLRDSEGTGKACQGNLIWGGDKAQNLSTIDGDTSAKLMLSRKETSAMASDENGISNARPRAARRGSGTSSNGSSLAALSNGSSEAPPVIANRPSSSGSFMGMALSRPRSWLGQKWPARQWETQSASALPHRLVLVRGKVQVRDPDWPRSKNPMEPLRCENAPDGGVALEKTQTYVYAEMKGFLGWMTQKEQVKYSRTTIPFVLEDVRHQFGSHAPFVWVALSGSRQPLPLTRVHSHMSPSEPSWNATALHYLLGHRLPVGLLEEEKVLKVGTQITAVGHLEKNSAGMPVIKSAKHMPCFLTGLTREELIAALAQQTRWLFWGGLAITTVAAGVLGYSCFKNWRRWKEELMRRRRNGQSAAAGNSSARLRNAAALVDDDVAEDGAPIGDGELCVVCLMRRRRAVFVHCGHRVCCCACARCIQEGPSPRCPICREEVASVYRVFDA